MINIKNSTSTVIGIILFVIATSLESGLFKTSLLVLVVAIFLLRLSYIFCQAYKNMQKVKIK